MTSRVSVVILNFNGDHFIDDLLSSLSKQTYPDFEIVFIDNASSDNSIDTLQKVIHNQVLNKINIKTIFNTTNLGFCKGNNQAFSVIKSEYIVFLNNDTYVAPDWLEHLVNILDSEPSVGACQSNIIFAKTGEIQTVGNQLDEYGWSISINKKTCPYLKDSKVFFYPSGASFIIRRSLMDVLGGFDELVFSGDYDLGWRIRLNGFNIISSFKSKCYHYGSYATKSYYPHLNQFFEACKERIYVLSKNYSFSRLILRLPISLILMLLVTTGWCFKSRQNYFLSYSQAVVWNIIKLNKLAKNRSLVQMKRKVPDSKIEESMSRHPLLFLLIK